ncbi:MAG TPA: (Fe-S)-binding protein [Desulfobacteraceae bacterium]|nr:(Fe-S)-binding protein [Desulfobacteraceae bacterium]|tara:strand:+ start:800 stop:1957 length:1158 start_codon:yes stop_codon:yes gene_type:complete
MQLSQQQIDYCMECGVCTGSCPVAMELPGFSPRQMIKRAMADPQGEILDSQDLWACLSCSRCSDRCPVEIDFPAFIREFRHQAKLKGNTAKPAHHGMFQTMTRIQTAQIRNDNFTAGAKRTSWAAETCKTASSGDYFYFSGCIAQYDVAFQYLDLNMIDTAKNNLRLLNALGITPVVSAQECCCGHDAHWNGDDETVEVLAKQNLDAIRESGAKTVIFGCPEGYAMFREVYADRFGPLEFEVVHITEFLARQMAEANTRLADANGVRVTFQDPCRLGRRSGIYEAPRELIGMVDGVELTEMEHNRENAICCGTTGWMQCSSCSKLMQIQRLREADAVGAQAIVTACPKCQIHLTCAKKNTDHDIEIIDLATFLMDRLTGSDDNRE